MKHFFFVVLAASLTLSCGSKEKRSPEGLGKTGNNQTDGTGDAPTEADFKERCARGNGFLQGETCVKSERIYTMKYKETDKDGKEREFEGGEVENLSEKALVSVAANWYLEVDFAATTGELLLKYPDGQNDFVSRLVGTQKIRVRADREGSYKMRIYPGTYQKLRVSMYRCSTRFSQIAPCPGL